MKCLRWQENHVQPDNYRISVLQTVSDSHGHLALRGSRPLKNLDPSGWREGNCIRSANQILATQRAQANALERAMELLGSRIDWLISKRVLIPGKVCPICCGCFPVPRGDAPETISTGCPLAPSGLQGTGPVHPSVARILLRRRLRQLRLTYTSLPALTQDLPHA